MRQYCCDRFALDMKRNENMKERFNKSHEITDQFAAAPKEHTKSHLFSWLWPLWCQMSCKRLVREAVLGV